METKKFEYKSSAETEHSVHKIELSVNGEHVGFANLEYRDNPFPFYYLSLIFINKEARGKKYGSDVLKEVMSWLNEKKKPAFLINSIEHDDPTRSMYERYGWKPIKERENWLAYNLPQDLDKGQINQALRSIY